METVGSFPGDAFRYKVEVYPGKEVLVNARLGGRLFQPRDKVWSPPRTAS